MQDYLHPSHKTRFSFGASSYDEICMDCGATDEIGSWGKLRLPCPGPKKNVADVIIDETWKDYRGDFNAMTDKEIERECERSRNLIDEEESWLEAVESWKRAGMPREDH